MNKCFFIKEPKVKPPCFIQLGRFGDLIQLFPAFKAVRDRTGQTATVITSTQYMSVFEGISYTNPVASNWEWWEGIPKAKQLADDQFGGGIILQWWLDAEAQPPFHYPDLIKNPGGIILQCHGREWGVDIARWPDYGTSMWDRAGFTREEMKTLPLVFDRRDYQRELVLYHQVKDRKNLPLLLINFNGQSSPFAAVPEVMGVINRFRRRFQIVDLGLIRAEKIFDLLGLYDRAVGLVTIDTSTLHLAPATRIPYFAYTVGGWNSSVPKRNCQCEVKYTEAGKPEHLASLEAYLDWLTQKNVKKNHQEPALAVSAV
jgi:hypothetical protein